MKIDINKLQPFFQRRWYFMTLFMSLCLLLSCIGIKFEDLVSIHLGLACLFFSISIWEFSSWFKKKLRTQTMKECLKVCQEFQEAIEQLDEKS